MKKRQRLTAYARDIRRTIYHERRRFAAIVLITLLGVMMFSGLGASCADLRKSADFFFDRQNLHDLVIMSTLGLTDDDVNALNKLGDISQAEGVYSEEVTANLGSRSVTITLKTLTNSGIDTPYILEGSLPSSKSEIAATQKFMRDCNAEVGDTITLTQDSTDSFTGQSFTITGIVTDPTNVDNPFGSVSYRTDSSSSDTLFILKDAVKADYYTSVVLTVRGASDLFCYSDSYEEKIGAVRGTIEDSIRQEREDARSEEIRNEAQEKLDDEKADAEKELSDAKKELEDGEQELRDKETDALKEIAEGEATFAKKLADAADKLAAAQEELDRSLSAAVARLQAAQRTLDDNAATLTQKKQELSAAKSQLEDAQAQLDDSGKELEAQKENTLTQLSDGISQIRSAVGQIDAVLSEVEDGLEQIDSSLKQMDDISGASTEVAAVQEPDATLPEEQKAALEEQKSTLEAQKAPLEKQKTDLEIQLTELLFQQTSAQQQFTAADKKMEESRKQIETGLEQVADGESQISDAEKQLAAGQKSIDSGWNEYNEGRESGQSQIAAGWDQYYSGKAEGEQKIADAKEEIAEGIAQGREELDEGWDEYNDALSKFNQKIADAQKEIDDLDTATWYVQDRSSLSGYSNIGSDADSIEAIGTVFPIVFFVVAILISLTAITRMVDEDRGLIGTYKSLGYTDIEISRKYLVYAFAASLCGSVLGTVCAFIALPEFIFTIFSIMYLLPSYSLSFVPLTGILGPAIFISGIVLSALAALRAELHLPPASLMRPKAPRAGSRVLLERVPVLWRHLSFLGKVTGRNLFRYKKRMFMTIFGIAGCMALLLFGFAIRDSVSDLRPRQYEETLHYDLLAVSSADDNEKLVSYISEDAASFINGLVDSAKIKYRNSEISATLVVVPDGSNFSDYVSLRDTASGEDLSLSSGDVYVTLNAGNVLGFKENGIVNISLSDLQSAEIPVTALVKNYLGNYIYMTRSTWETYYEDYAPNGALVNLNESVKDQTAYAKNLGEKKGVISCISTKELADQFSGAFQLINAVVWIVIGMSAALAFVVLFTLSTTNISEREREIATIKVLGFFDREVHLYIDRETDILTCIGILLGIPLGWAFAQTLTSILNLPSIYLEVSLHVRSYFYAAALTLLFLFVVNRIMDTVLNRVDPVGALKSVE